MKNKRILVVVIVLTVAGCALSGWRKNSPGVGAVKHSSLLCEQEIAPRSYSSLDEAIEAARFGVRLAAQTPDHGLANAYHAPNPQQNYDSYFDLNGLHLRQRNQDSTFAQTNMKLRGYGYGEQIVELIADKISSSEQRVEISHRLLGKAREPIPHTVAGGSQRPHHPSATAGGADFTPPIIEWYVNRPEGLEQGFTVNRPLPNETKNERLKLTLDIDSPLKANEGGQEILFKNHRGEAALRYSKLKALDADGKELAARMFVGANSLSLEVDDSGAVYPITIDPTFTQQQKLVPGFSASDSFGTDVAISGDTAVVGVPLDDAGANQNQGSIFVFVRSGTTWWQQARLFASDGAADDNFGSSVAISANTIIVGAPGDDIGANQNQGSAYVFVRSGTTWTQQAKLTVSSADLLGRDVTIDGDYAAIINLAEVQIFHRTGTSWAHESTVATSGFSAASVSLSGETLIVGTPGFGFCAPPPLPPNCTASGAAYIFVRSGTVWESQEIIVGNGLARIGRSVAISGNTIAIGGSGTNRGNVGIWFRSGTTWTNQSTINGQTNENIGKAVTIDGDTVVYTAPGGSKVLVRTGTIWTTQATLTSVGEKVSLSGNTLLTGSPGYAKVDVRTGTTWAEQAELTAQEGATADQFGYSVAIDGDTAVIGVPFKNVGTAADRGSVFVFKRSGSTWQQEAQLTAGDGAAGDRFGNAVAIEVDTVAIGAQHDDTFSGAVYIFTRSGSVWTQRLKIIPADRQVLDLFGNSVALSGNTLVIGSPLDDNQATGDNGSAYVFTGSGATWTLQAKLNAIEEADGDQFGHDVDIDGETLAVGARFVDNGANTLQGAAYVFTRTGTTWAQQARLMASDGATDDQFGESISVSGDRLAVGSPFHNIGANSNQGAVYLFNRAGSAWTQSQMLTANDGVTDDTFGISVALQSDALLVGASGDDFASTNAQGSAYVFIPFGPTWTQTQKLFATDGATNDGYGNAVALNDRTFLIGASNDDFGSTVDQGSAFVIVPSGPSVWTGANSANWSTGSNWDASVAPNIFDDVLLPASGVTNEAVLNANASIHSLTVEAGRSLNINAGRTLTVNGELTLNGTITGGGTLTFNGANFVNNNSVNVANVRFGAGVKQLSGTGSFFINTVTVLSGSTLQLSSNHTMNRLVVNNGGALNISSANTLSLLGSGVAFTNNGSVTATGTVSFDGTSPQSTSGSVTFSGLSVNNAAGVTLGADTTVNNTLTLTSGDLNTGAFTLTMPATATSTGTTDVVGNVRRAGFTTANTLSFGNPFNTIRFTSGAVPTDVTMTLVKALPSAFNNAVRRRYTITPNGGSGFAATLRLRYQDSELNGNSEATLGLWRNNGTWVNLGATTRNATDNWVELTGIAQFSPWAISGPQLPDPGAPMISGRILKTDSTPLAGAAVNLQGAQTEA